MNGIEWALAHGMRVFVAELPKGDDPDSFVRREGGAALEAVIAAARPYHLWRLENTPAPELPFWMGQGENR